MTLFQLFTRVGLVVSGLLFGVTTANAQSLFAQVDISFEADGGGCSILRAESDGMLTEWVSNSEILAVTGELDADCADTDITIAPDDTLYYAEDTSHDILRVDPTGVVSVFVDSATIDAVVGTTSDIDNGMALGPDGNLYAADEDCDCIIQITIPDGTVSVFAAEADFDAIYPDGGTVDPNGGLVVDSAGTVYLTSDNNPDTIFAVANDGAISILSNESQILAATGKTEADLDVGMDLAASGLFVLDDQASDNGALINVDIVTGDATQVVSGSEVTAVTGLEGFNPEGGIAVQPGSGDLFVGDDGFSLADDESKANILRITQAGEVSIFLSDAELSGFYSTLYPNADFSFEGGLVFAIPEPVEPRVSVPMNVPSLSGIALLLLMLLAGILGVQAFARRSN